MNRIRHIYILLGLTAAGAFVSCSGVKSLSAPQLDVPEHIIAGADDSLTLADVEWWSVYGDASLQKIIRTTLAHNRTLQAAAATIEEMQQLYRVGRAGLFPALSAEVAADYETNDYYHGKSSRDAEYDLKASISWEADLFGRLRWAKKQGYAKWMGAVEDYRAVKMTLIAEAATAYFNLVALDNELDIVQRTLRNRSESVEKAKLRFEGGLTSELVYQQACVEYASTASLVPSLQQRISTTENQLKLLMGEFPGESVGRIGSMVEIPDSARFSIGLPSQLINRRPDIRSANQKLMAASAQVGVDYADRFPRLTISLVGGAENDDLTALLKSPFSYIGGNLIAPLFDFGKKKARYKASVAAYDRARLQYENTVIQAFTDVADAVTVFRNARKTLQLKTNSRDAARKYVELAELQYRAGSISYIDVLDAQRRYFDAQIGHSNAIRDENLALVNLYKALGGGW